MARRMCLAGGARKSWRAWPSPVALLAIAAATAPAAASLAAFIVPRWAFSPAPRATQLQVIGRHAQKAEFLVNDAIKSLEVRVIAEVDEATGAVEECNFVVSTQDALRRAKDKGLDLIMINESADPPIVKIMSQGKYAYEEGKRLREKAASAKVPKLKEIKMSYTVGENDLQVKLRQAEGWLEVKGAQVSFSIILKGRAKAFGQQAMDLMKRIREELAAFGKAAGADSGKAIIRDKAGDVQMTLTYGPDQALLKQIAAEADAAAAAKAAVDGGGSPAAMPEVEVSAPAPAPDLNDPLVRELEDLKKEFQEVKDSLLTCGIKPGQITSQPEWRELMQRESEIKKKMKSAQSALGSSFGTRGFSLVASSSSLASFALAGVVGASLARRRRL